MTTGILPLGNVESTLELIAAAIREQHRDVIRELRLVYIEGGVIIHGKATSFYGKQVAFHELKRRMKLEVLANAIVVDPTATPCIDCV
ncbi:MAG TPA: hypothetical protein VLM40_19830 [Gemmata sp.]|nr:hypothetical protein [Gemmata sp.]